MDYEDIITDANHLYDGLLKSIQNSKWKQSSQKAILLALPTLFTFQRQLRDRVFRFGTGYSFTLSERGRSRVITSLNVLDRTLRHVLSDVVFMPIVRKKIIYDNGASVEDRGISFSRDRFEAHIKKYVREHKTNKGYILFGDYSKFYDNIDHGLAKQMFLELVDYDPFVTWILDNIFEAFEIDVSGYSDDMIEELTNGVFNRLEYEGPITDDHSQSIKKSINIGDQLSQLIGIYYPHEVDNYIKIVLGEKYYGRYMDDWYIIHESKDHLIDLLNLIDQESNKIGLHINFDKTDIVPLDKPFRYLQFKYTVLPSGKVRKQINPKRIYCMRRKLKKLAVKVENNEINYYDVESMFKSWMGSFYKVMTKRQIDGLFELYENLFDVDICVIQGKILIERNENECTIEASC